MKQQKSLDNYQNGIICMVYANLTNLRALLGFVVWHAPLRRLILSSWNLACSCPLLDTRQIAVSPGLSPVNVRLREHTVMTFGIAWSIRLEKPFVNLKNQIVNNITKVNQA